MRKKNIKELVKELPNEAADFITVIIRKMKYRKKIRAEVAEELANHFFDELKNCQNDKTKQEKIAALISEFGDTKMLAVLLRRAKKRCRSLWRTAIVRGFQAIGVLILCAIVYVGWFLSGKPAITVNYLEKLNQMARPVADDSENAAPFYVEAAEIVEKMTEEQKKFISKAYKKSQNLTDDEKQQAKTIVAENAKIFELIKKGSQKRYYWQEYTCKNYSREGLLATLLPKLSEYRSIVRLYRLRLNLYVNQGQMNKAIEDIKICHVFGQHMRSGNRSLIEQLVGISISAVTYRAIANMVDRHDMSLKQLYDLQLFLEQSVDGKSFIMSLEFERLCLRDAIQRWFTEDYLGDGHLYLKGIFDFVVENPNWPLLLIYSPKVFLHPSKKQTIKDMEKFYTSFEQRFLKTPSELKREKTDLDSLSPCDFDGNVFLNIMLPPLGEVHVMNHRLKTDFNATITILAIKRYQNEKKQLPNSLQQLVDENYLKTMPDDPFSDSTLVYKKQNGDFILYSFGENMTDEGGEIDESEKQRSVVWHSPDAVFWPVVNQFLSDAK